MTRIMDDDAVVACADLVERSGARSFELGHTKGRTPTWHASAQFAGARVVVEGFPDPPSACDGLARRLLSGGVCKCGRLMTLTDNPEVDPATRSLYDGRVITPQDAAQMGWCRWRRMGNRWEMSCTTHPG